MDTMIDFIAGNRAVRFPITFAKNAGRVVNFLTHFYAGARNIYIPVCASLPVIRDPHARRIGDLDVLKIVTLDPHPIPDRDDI